MVSETEQSQVLHCIWGITLPCESLSNHLTIQNTTHIDSTLGNMVRDFYVSHLSRLQRRCTSTSRPLTWTTAHTASVNGKTARPAPKTSSSAPSSHATSLATPVTALMPAATKVVTKLLLPIKPKTITRGRTRASDPMYVIAADTQPRHTHSYRHTLALFTRVRSRTSAASASSHARIQVT